MSNSPLISGSVKFGFKKSNPRKDKTYNPTGDILVITPHHMAGVSDAKSCAERHLKDDIDHSANYYIGYEGEIYLGVAENRRSWASGSRENDYKAVTIEVSNSETGGEWPISDASWKSLVNLCVDICKRNKIKEIVFTGDAKGNLTMHKYFQATECPGHYLETRFPQLAKEINDRLGVKPTPQPTPVEPDTKKIWDYMVKTVGMTEYATAGFMGNWQEESGFRGNNLQNTFEKRFNTTDAQYTADVDSGKISKDSFIHDSAGYGLSQWTFWSRKSGLYDYMKSKGYSIGNIDGQLEFVKKEMESNKVLKNKLNASKSVREASDIVLHEYERPSDQSEATEERRASYGQSWYNQYASGTPEPVPEPSETPFVVRVKTEYLNIRTGPGTNYPITGEYTGVGAFTIVETSYGQGSKSGWGKLKSEKGWISLDFTERI